MPPQSLQKVLIVGAIVIATGLALWELQRILGGVSPTDKTGNPAVTASPSPPLQPAPHTAPPPQEPPASNTAPPVSHIEAFLDDPEEASAEMPEVDPFSLEGIVSPVEESAPQHINAFPDEVPSYIPEMITMRTTPKMRTMSDKEREHLADEASSYELETITPGEIITVREMSDEDRLAAATNAKKLRMVANDPLSPPSLPSSEHLADYPLATDPWGDVLNPSGSVPKQGFAVWYLDRDATANEPQHKRKENFQIDGALRISDTNVRHYRTVTRETTNHIAINYGLSAFRDIPSDSFSAYWAGRLHVPQAGRYHVIPQISWANVRVLLDRHIVADGNQHGIDVPPPLLLDAGDYLLEVEYSNHWHTTQFQLAVEPDFPAIKDEELQSALAALHLPPQTVVYINAVNESNEERNRIRLQVPEDDTPYILLLSSEQSVNWVITGRPPLAIANDNRGSTVSGAPDAPQFIWNSISEKNLSPGSLSYHSPCFCTPQNEWVCPESGKQPFLLEYSRRHTGYPLRGMSSANKTYHLNIAENLVYAESAATQMAREQQRILQRESCAREGKVTTPLLAKPQRIKRNLPAFQPSYPSGATLADFPLAAHTWGDVINPRGKTPRHGFNAWYLRITGSPGADYPAETIAQENVPLISIRNDGAEGRFKIERSDFGAYWVGRVHVPRTGRYRLITAHGRDFSDTETRVLLDRHILSSQLRQNNLTLQLAAGDHRLEVEYRGADNANRFQAMLIADDKLTFPEQQPPAPTSTPLPVAIRSAIAVTQNLATAIAALHLPADTVVYAATVSNSGDRYNRLRLHAPAGDTPYILLLNSTSAVQAEITGRPPVLILHNPASRINGADTVPTFYWEQNFGDEVTQMTLIDCDCTALRKRSCDAYSGAALIPFARKIQQTTGYPLAGISSGHNTTDLVLPLTPVDDRILATSKAIRHTINLRRQHCVAQQPL